MKDTSKTSNSDKVSKEEEIGFHKGAVSTLLKERDELLKMVNVVNQILQAHLSSLEGLGVEINPAESASGKSNIEDLI